MSLVVKQTVLSKVLVQEAMRKQVIRLSQKTRIDKSINYFIKYKINALLVSDENGRPAGVVSKTDLMGAYYAGLPIESPLEDMMSSPPLFCSASDSLESALDQMKSASVYRLYVLGDASDEVAGVLAYPDIVGLLYLYCHECDYSHLKRKKSKRGENGVLRFTVREVMTDSVKAFAADALLMEIMEGLSEYRFGAVLITDRESLARGVVSKTDLMLAYKHGISAEEPARTIMSSPVRSCPEDDLLENAIREMIYSEVHRVFVHKDDPRHITGVLSLSDAARLRSGSCHACMCSRIRVDE